MSENSKPAPAGTLGTATMTKAQVDDYRATIDLLQMHGHATDSLLETVKGLIKTEDDLPDLRLDQRESKNYQVDYRPGTTGYKRLLNKNSLVTKARHNLFVVEVPYEDRDKNEDKSKMVKITDDRGNAKYEPAYEIWIFGKGGRSHVIYDTKAVGGWDDNKIADFLKSYFQG